MWLFSLPTVSMCYSLYLTHSSDLNYLLACTFLSPLCIRVEAQFRWLCCMVIYVNVASGAGQGRPAQAHIWALHNSQSFW